MDAECEKQMHCFKVIGAKLWRKCVKPSTAWLLTNTVATIHLHNQLDHLHKLLKAETGLDTSCCFSAISLYVPDDHKVPTCCGTWMYHKSCDIRLVTLGGREGTDKAALTVSDRSRGQELKLLCLGLAWLRPTVSKLEKNLTAELLDATCTRRHGMFEPTIRILGKGANKNDLLHEVLK